MYGMLRYYLLLALLDFRGGSKWEAGRHAREFLRRAGISLPDSSIQWTISKLKYDFLLDPINRPTERGRKVMEIFRNMIVANGDVLLEMRRKQKLIKRAKKR
jgi:hypothetical protein